MACGIPLAWLQYEATSYRELQPSLAGASILLYARLLTYLRSFRSFGPLVTLLINVMTEMLPFLLIMVVIIQAFAECFVYLGAYTRGERGRTSSTSVSRI